ncbi:hypothetical protein L2E48_26270, partial [Salmonella enterica subsp. enterica serovar Weltevreden]|nr:hypothetical protein [Salmonella enterica subsp. enterica serovar Weltevreden]
KARREDYLPIPVSTDLDTVEEVVALVEVRDVEAVVITSGHSFVPGDVRRLGWELQERGVSLIMAPALVDVAGPRL